MTDVQKQWVCETLDVLEQATLPELISTFPDEEDFWCAFSAIADDIVEHAGIDEDYAHGRVDCMLKNAGLIPGEDEGERCE